MTQIAEMFDDAGAQEALRPPRLPDFELAVESGRRQHASPLDPDAARADVSRMGMCVAIAADSVFFASVLGVALTVRSAHPELFAYGRYFLSAHFGVMESSVLLMSMLAGALAAQLASKEARGELRGVLALVTLLGCAFLGLQAFETSDLAEQGLLPGARFTSGEAVWKTAAFRAEHPDAARFAETFRFAPPRARAVRGRRSIAAPPVQATDMTTSLVAAGALGEHAVYPDVPSEPRNAHLFFGVFYLVTFVHAAHVLVGIVVWGWLFARTFRPAPTARLATALDAASLYWNFATLMRVALFPLFYLT